MSGKDVLIAIWLEKNLRTKINNKFNVNGFFICNKENDIYTSISYGLKFNYESFINHFKDGKIILDSGMKNGNSRNYSSFRANSNFWKEKIIMTFK